MSTSTQF